MEAVLGGGDEGKRKTAVNTSEDEKAGEGQVNWRRWRKQEGSCAKV